jgi:uncharacterized protein YijF (DUF1287 family)
MMRIKFCLREHKLFLLKKDQVIKSYRIALCPDNPQGDKCKLGDGGTPEGRFYICLMVNDPTRLKYGPRSMLLSYPNIEDARRGYKSGLIDDETYQEIIRDLRGGMIPSQKTRLGGQIRIHGCGGKFDWTAGCVGMDDRDVIELYNLVRNGTRVDIYKSATQDRELNATDYLNQKILEGVRQALHKPDRYAYQSSSRVQSDSSKGVKASSPSLPVDAINRIFAQANLDLQALIQEDSIMNPGRYYPCNHKSRNSKDQTQMCNITTYLYRHAIVVPNSLGAHYSKYCRPGDIVLLGSAASRSPDYDGIGIVDNSRDSNGLPNIIPLWGKNKSANSLYMKNNPSFVIQCCFRLAHPFEYQFRPRVELHRGPGFSGHRFCACPNPFGILF